LAIFATVAPASHAQQYSRGNLSMGMTVSINTSRLFMDSTKYQASVLPGIGAAFYSGITPRLIVNYGAQFSMMGSEKYDTLGKLRTYYIEPFISLQYKITEGLRIEGGALYSKLVMAQTVKATGESSTGQKRETIEGFSSYPEFFAGVHLDMNKQSTLGLRYYLPLKNQEFRRIEVRLVYILVEGYTKKRRE
jgi:hypothetical protein